MVAGQFPRYSYIAPNYTELQPMHWSDHLLFFLFGVVFPWQAIFRTQPTLQGVENWDTRLKKSLYISNSISLWVMAFVVLIAWWLLGRPLSGLGVCWPEPLTWRLGVAGSLVFIMAYVTDVWLEVRTPEALAKTRAHWRKHTPFMPENRKEVQLFYLVAISAAVAEEIVFRGFFVYYFTTWFAGNPWAPWIAIGIPSLIFAISHYYQGWKAMFKIALLSLIFGWLLVYTHSLLIPILLHFAVDVAGGYLSLWLKEGEPEVPDVAFSSEEEE
jgi:membrane protease YdiL (CAAX protease family)